MTVQEDSSGPLLPAAAPPFRYYVRFESIDPAKRRCRFYTFSWQPTLWGELALVAHWGRIGTAGRSRVLGLVDGEAGAGLLADHLRRRLQHHYTLMESA